MHFSTPTAMPDIYAMNYLSNLMEKPPFSRAAPIHSTKVRQNIYKGSTTYGKLWTGFIREVKSGFGQKNRLQTENSKPQLPFRKNKSSLQINDAALEKDIQEFLEKPLRGRPQTTMNMYRPPGILSRVGTSQSQNRNTNSANFFMSTAKSFSKGILSPSADVTRRGLMCSTENVDGKEFTDDYVQEKYQHIVFAKASPAQENLKLLKLSNFDVTLVPNDSRRLVIEAIMRDYFLNLIPENSDFLICKNSQTHIYNIMFTGKLVPSCKFCSSIAQFEVSKDLGFRVLCTSEYCSLKVLYINNLSEYTIDSLWPVGSRSNLEPSVQFREITKIPTLSRLVQSGRFKRIDFSQVLTEVSVTQGNQPYLRPNTTANIMRITSPSQKFTRVMIKTTLETEPQANFEYIRPNTTQGLVNLKNSRPSTSGSGVMGMGMFKDFEERRPFSIEKAKRRSIEEIIEEKVGDEDQGGQTSKGRVIEKKLSKVASAGILKMKKKTQKGRKGQSEQELGLEDYSIKGEKKMIYGALNKTDRTDNSLDDIHNMVSLITSQENKNTSHS